MSRVKSQLEPQNAHSNKIKTLTKPTLFLKLPFRIEIVKSSISIFDYPTANNSLIRFDPSDRVSKDVAHHEKLLHNKGICK